MFNRFLLFTLLVVVGLLGFQPSAAVAQSKSNPVQEAEELKKKLKDLETKVKNLLDQQKALQEKLKVAEKNAEEFKKQFVKVEIRGTLVAANPSLLDVGSGKKRWYVMARGMKWRLRIPENNQKFHDQFKQLKGKAVLISGTFDLNTAGTPTAASTPFVAVTTISEAKE